MCLIGKIKDGLIGGILQPNVFPCIVQLSAIFPRYRKTRSVTHFKRCPVSDHQNVFPRLKPDYRGAGEIKLDAGYESDVIEIICGRPVVKKLYKFKQV